MPLKGITSLPMANYCSTLTNSTLATECGFKAPCNPPKKQEDPLKSGLPIFPSTSSKSPSKPGIQMLYPEPCKEFRRRLHVFMVGIVPYKPSSTRVLIVAHLQKNPQPGGGHIFLWGGSFLRPQNGDERASGAFKRFSSARSQSSSWFCRNKRGRQRGTPKM